MPVVIDPAYVLVYNDLPPNRDGNEPFPKACSRLSLGELLVHLEYEWVVPFSFNKWASFRLTKCRLKDPSGPLFG